MSSLSTTDALRSLAGPQAQAGWQTLVERHGGDVWRLILSRSRDVDEAEDTYQEFWIRLPRAATAFTPPGGDQERSARAWLMRVAYTIAIDRARRSRPVTVEVQGVAMGHETPTARLFAQDHIRPGTEDLAVRDYFVARVQGAMKDLPESYRRPILLYVVGGLSYEELATDLQCTVNNARVRVHRGLKRLRSVLGDDARLNDRVLAGMMLPVMFATPPAPALSEALSASVEVATSGVATGGAMTSGVATGGMAMTVTAGVLVTAGIGVLVAFGGGAPSQPVRPADAPVPQVRTLDDFTRNTVGLLGSSSVGKPPELSLAPAPAGGAGSALRLAWSATNNKWVDCHYPPRTKAPLLGVTASAATAATMQVWVPAHQRVRHMAIRFMDTQGEIFEWRQPLAEQSQAGWQTLTFPLDPATIAVWHSQSLVDGRIDLPMTLRGYAVDLYPNNTSAGVVIIDQVQIQQPLVETVAEN